MFKKLLGPLLIVIALIVVVLLVISKPKPETKAELPQQIVPVSVDSISPESHPLLIKTEGFVDSRWRATLSAEVSGQVMAVSDQLLLGNSFDKGEVLVTLNPLDFAVKVARATASVKAAESNLAEQEMQASQAKSDWQKLNPSQTPSNFNLRLPQLHKAQSEFKAAQQELKLAKENLNRTQIKAPFSGFAVSRTVDLGENIQAGSEIAEVVANQQLQIKVGVDIADAKLLHQTSDIKFQLFDSSGVLHTDWSIKKIRFEPFVDSENRFQSMILEFNESENTPLLGDFIKVEMTTTLEQPLLAVPESALSVEGQIWYVENNNLTNRFNPVIIYQADGVVYANVDPALDYPLSIIMAPPNSLMKGIKVKPDAWTDQESSEEAAANE